MSGISEMILRVAGALANYMASNRNFQNQHVSMARAAIEAMREPTPEMVEAGFVVERNYERDPDTYDDPISFTAYKAMIAAALAPARPDD